MSDESYEIDSLKIIQEVSDRTGVNWNAESMLRIACSFIDEHDESAMPFEDYVEACAKIELGERG